MFPVGLISKYQVSSPVVKNGTITGFYDGWLGGRKYPLDMAGFAVSVKFLHKRPKAQMPFKPGYEEDGFLRSLEPLELKEVELLASNCTEVSKLEEYFYHLMPTQWFALFGHLGRLSFPDTDVAHAGKEKSSRTGPGPQEVRRHEPGTADQLARVERVEHDRTFADGAALAKETLRLGV